MFTQICLLSFCGYNSPTSGPLYFNICGHNSPTSGPLYFNKLPLLFRDEFRKTKSRLCEILRIICHDVECKSNYDSSQSEPRRSVGARDQRHAPAALPKEKKPRYPLYRRLYGLRSRSGRLWKREVCPHPGFELRTVEPVACRYTDYTIPSCNSRI